MSHGVYHQQPTGVTQEDIAIALTSHQTRPHDSSPNSSKPGPLLTLSVPMVAFPREGQERLNIMKEKLDEK